MRQLPNSRHTYVREFRDRMVQRYLTGTESYREIARAEGVDVSTLRGWVRRRQAGAMTNKQPPAVTVDDRSATEKFRLLLAAKSLPDAELGEFLRREGLKQGDLERWEQDALGGLERAAAGQSTERQLLEAQKHIRKTDARLREAEALLDLQKKVHALWGAADDDTKDR